MRLSLPLTPPLSRWDNSTRNKDYSSSLAAFARSSPTQRRRAYLPTVIASISSFCLMPSWPSPPNCLCFSSLRLRDRWARRRWRRRESIKCARRDQMLNAILFSSLVSVSLYVWIILISILLPSLEAILLRRFFDLREMLQAISFLSTACVTFLLN